MLVANMNQVARSQRIFGNFGGYDVGPLLCHFRAMLGHLELCWGLSGVKFQPQPKHGSVEVEFCLGFGLMLGHLEAMLGYLELCWRLSGLNFNPNGSMAPLRLNLGSVSGFCWAIWRLCWDFVVPSFRPCWNQIWQPALVSQPECKRISL